MARTGRFGSLPARAPDLTNTIVALMEAYENQRDRNILTAWQAGGDFEGEPVTDQRLKKWFLDRKHEYTKGDPEFDYWAQQFEQVDYDIGESKALLRYAQGGMSEMGMSRWYSSNASRFPKDSEAWREAMRNAAGYKKAGQEKTHTTAVISDYEKWNRSIGALQKNKVDPANRAVEIVDSVLRTMGYGGGSNEFMNLDAGQRNAINTQIQDALRSGGRYEKYARQWERLTGSKFSYRSFKTILRRGKEGSKQQASVSRQYGYSPAQFTQQARDFDTREVALSVFRSNALDTYLDARGQYEQDMKDAKTPEERMDIRAGYRKTLRGIQRSLDESGDESAGGAVTAELNALEGKAGKQDIGYLGSGLNAGSSAASVAAGGGNDELILNPDGSLVVDAYEAGAARDNAFTRFDQQAIKDVAAGTAVYVDPQGDGTHIPVKKSGLKLVNGGIPSPDIYAQYPDENGNIIFVPKTSVMMTAVGTNGDRITVEVPGLTMANLDGTLVYFTKDQEGKPVSTNVAPLPGEMTWSEPDKNGVRTAIFTITTPDSGINRSVADKTVEDQQRRIAIAAGQQVITNVEGRDVIGGPAEAPATTAVNPDGTPVQPGVPVEVPARTPTPEQESRWLERKWGGRQGWVDQYNNNSNGGEDTVAGAAWEEAQRAEARVAIQTSLDAGVDPDTDVRFDTIEGTPEYNVLNGIATPDATPVTPTPGTPVTAQDVVANTPLESVFSEALKSADQTGVVIYWASTAQSRARARKSTNPQELYKQALLSNGIDAATNPEAAYALGSAIDSIFLITDSPNGDVATQERDYILRHPMGSYRQVYYEAEAMRQLDEQGFKSVSDASANTIVRLALDAGVSASDFKVTHPDLVDEYMSEQTLRSRNQEVGPESNILPQVSSAEGLVTSGIEGVAGGVADPIITGPSTDWWKASSQPAPGGIQPSPAPSAAPSGFGPPGAPMNLNFPAPVGLPNPFTTPIIQPPIKAAARVPERYDPARYVPTLVQPPITPGFLPKWGAPPPLAWKPGPTPPPVGSVAPTPPPSAYGGQRSGGSFAPPPPYGHQPRRY